MNNAADELADLVAAAQRRQRSSVSIDNDRDQRNIHLRSDEMERHHEAVVEQKVSGVCKVEFGLQSVGDNLHGQRPFHWNSIFGDSKVTGRAAFPDADTKRWHVVHEEVAKVGVCDDHYLARVSSNTERIALNPLKIRLEDSVLATSLVIMKGLWEAANAATICAMVKL